MKRIRTANACIRWVIAGACCLTLCASWSAGTDTRPGVTNGQPSAVPHAPLECGSERWAVKTLSDDDAPRMRFDNPIATTIIDLNGLTPRCQAGPDRRAWPEEFKVYELVGRVKSVRAEQDRDIHIVLADPEEPNCVMVVEIADPACSGAADSPHVAMLVQARSMFSLLLRSGLENDPRPLIGRLVRVRGVGFFDFDHGQEGKSRSCIELHPVLSMAIEPNASSEIPGATDHSRR